jgi:hypothetical protein
MAYFTLFFGRHATALPLPRTRCYGYTCVLRALSNLSAESGVADRFEGRVAQLVRALLSHSRGPGFESLRVHIPTLVVTQPTQQR